MNRDITARAIKEYLNLNVSTYTILRATKLFEWNKVNPNSNDSKKAAAIERQVNGSGGESTTAAEEDGLGVDGEGDETNGGKRKRSRRSAGSIKSRVGRKYKKRKSGGENGETSETGAGGPGTGGSEMENGGLGSGSDFDDDDDEEEEVEKIQLKPLVDQEMKKGGGDMENRPYSMDRKSSKPRHTVNSIPGLILIGLFLENNSFTKFFIVFFFKISRKLTST